MDPYASHQQLLIATALQSKGSMIEMGCGDYSTPLLVEIAAYQNRSFEVYTTDMSWGSKYKHLCKVNHINSWDDYPYPNVGFTFLDNEQYVRDRKLLVPKLLQTSDVVICHDFGDNVGNAKYSVTLNGNPPSVVMSNVIDIKIHTNKFPVATVCTVYKTGGDYTAEYVHKIYEGVKQNTTLPFEFYCFTNSDEELPGTKIALNDDLPGWWSKMELFKKHIGRAVYFDLDTIIVGNIDKLLEYDGPMAMLQDFCNPELASGVMAWNSPLQFIYYMAMEREAHIRDNPKMWDQHLIEAALKDKKWSVDIIQNIVKTYSYKLHCKDGTPSDASIVCFHGKPRPHEINWMIGG
jgi:hypothetical protein